MKWSTTKFLRIVSSLTAVMGALVLFCGTMIGFGKYREKLTLQPTRPANDSLLVSAKYPQMIRDSVMLLEIKIKAGKNRSQAVIIWNGREISRIQAYGHHFIKIPKEWFHSKGNILLVSGLTADARLAILEVKNLYGYSTGLLKSVIILPDSQSVKRLSWPLAILLALLLLFFSIFVPGAVSLTSKNRWLRYGAWAIIAFFLAILTLPLFISYRIFLGFTTTLWLLCILYWPGLWRVLRRTAGYFQARVLPWIKAGWLQRQSKSFQWRLLAGLGLAAIFIFFSVHRQRYVGAADWYGYYAESLLFRQGQLTMKIAFSPEQYPAFAPLGFYAVGNKIIPQYPPGYPFLLALFGLFRLEFFVNALCGVLTILVLYLILKNSVSRGLAMLYASLWAFFPMTLLGSMNLMSDLIATLFILLTYYFFTRNKIFWSGVAFSCAVMIRPSNVLFFIVFLPLLFKKKKFWPFCFSASIIGSLYGLYNWTVFGKPWMTGYGIFANDLTDTVFFHHFIYYGKTILIIMTPLLLIPVLWALLRRKPYNWFYFSWMASFWIFYSFWKSGGGPWWYLRFLLPGLPALFILSAAGMQDMRERLLAWKPGWKKILNASAILILLVMLPYFITYSKKNLVFSSVRGKLYFQASKKIRSLVPPDALVGGIEMSGPLRLYAGMESFRWNHPQIRKLIHDFLTKGRPIYLIIESWNKQQQALNEISMIFDLKNTVEIPESMGMMLSQVCLRKK